MTIVLWCALYAGLAALVAWLGALAADNFARDIAKGIAKGASADIAITLRYRDRGGDIQRLADMPRREWERHLRTEGHDDLAKLAADTA